jgi:hypothetical protein
MSSKWDFWRRGTADRQALHVVATALVVWVGVPLAIIWAILILVDSTNPDEPLGVPVSVTVMARLSGDIYAVNTRDPRSAIDSSDPYIYNPFEDPDITVVTVHGRQLEDGQQLTLYRNPDGQLAEAPALSGHDWGGSPRDWGLIGLTLVIGAFEIARRIKRRVRIRVSGNDHDERVRRRRAQGVRKRR